MAELLENLEIKWQLLAAQTVNFFILLFVLKKFLYKPMLKFLKERREAIEEGLKKVKEAVKIIKASKGRLKEIENEFEEIKKEVGLENSKDEDIPMVEDIPL